MTPVELIEMTPGLPNSPSFGLFLPNVYPFLFQSADRCIYRNDKQLARSDHHEREFFQHTKINNYADESRRKTQFHQFLSHFVGYRNQKDIRPRLQFLLVVAYFSFSQHFRQQDSEIFSYISVG